MRILFKYLKVVMLLLFLSCSNVNSAKNTIKNSSKLDSTTKGIMIVNLDKDRILYEENSSKLLVPASLMKLPTTIAALDVLGEDFRYQTSLAYDGSIEDGVLKGNLYILGGGDPTLGSKYLFKKNRLEFLSEWVRWTKKLGIKEVLGSIIVDTSHYGEYLDNIDTWEWMDLNFYYGAPVYSLNFFDNTLSVSIKDTEVIGVSPKNNVVHIDSDLVHGSTTDLKVAIPPYSDTITLRGEVDTDFTRRFTMPNPPLVLGDIFASRLRKEGISNRGSKTINYINKDSLNTYYTTYSPSLIEIMAPINKRSINLYAEALKLETEKTINTTLENYWRDELGYSDIKIYDGSGLSRYNSISPKFIIDLLTRISRSSNFSSYYDTLAIAGIDPTFKRFNEEVFVDNLRGKSGTLGGIKGFSGYFYNRKGELIAYSIILNHHRLTRSEIFDYVEEVLYPYY